MARCFRDEDLRADRQQEFTQLDLEMSFIDREDIIDIVSKLVARLMKDVKGEKSRSRSRVSYDEAMERFGSDSPDLRFGMELKDITDIAKNVEFRVFRSVAESKTGAFAGSTSKSRRQIQPQRYRRLITGPPNSSAPRGSYGSRSTTTAN